MNTILQANDICMVFGGIWAVNHLSVDVFEGEILGIIGPNGSGKTSFFNVLTGSYKATSGTVSFKGKDLTRKPMSVASQAGISRTFQNIRLFPSMTVKENVLMGLHNELNYSAFSAMFRGKRCREDEKIALEKVDGYLDFVNILDKKEELATNLAYGDQRRVELARALACQPSLLLLDELTSGMNDVEAHQMMEIIRKTRDDSGMTIMMIEHNMQIMMSTAERIVAMDAGSKIAEGIPEFVQKDPAVIESYLGKDEED